MAFDIEIARQPSRLHLQSFHFYFFTKEIITALQKSLGT